MQKEQISFILKNLKLQYNKEAESKVDFFD
jgi:hypothetical protein